MSTNQELINSINSNFERIFNNLNFGVLKQLQSLFDNTVNAITEACDLDTVEPGIYAIGDEILYNCTNRPDVCNLTGPGNAKVGASPSAILISMKFNIPGTAYVGNIKYHNNCTEKIQVLLNVSGGIFYREYYYGGCKNSANGPEHIKVWSRWYYINPEHAFNITMRRESTIKFSSDQSTPFVIDTLSGQYTKQNTNASGYLVGPGGVFKLSGINSSTSTGWAGKPGVGVLPSEASVVPAGKYHFKYYV